MSNQKEKSLLTWQQRVWFRSLMVLVVALLMSIPWYLWQQFVQHRTQQVLSQQQSLAEAWGGQQRLQAPILVIPYVEHLVSVDTVIGEDGANQVVSRDVFKDKTAIFLPSSLIANIHLKDQYRYQDDYKSLVYTADLDLTGQFDISQLLAENKKRDRINIEWHKAFIAIGLSQTKSIRKASHFLWDKKSLSLQSGTQLTDLLPQGFHSVLTEGDFDGNEPRYSFNVKLSVNGNQRFQIAPFGAETQIHITSPWRYTKIDSVIPADEWISDAQGLSAKWQVSHLVRNYPQYWLLEEKKIKQLDEVNIGVALHDLPAQNPYLAQSLQWGLVILVLIFLLFFVMDLLTKARLHWVQYIILGLIVQSFFIALITLESYLGFRLIYYAASAVSLLFIYLYAILLFRRFFASLFVLLLSAAIFATLYAMLYYEDYRLLIIAGFVLTVTFLLMLSSLRAHRYINHFDNKSEKTIKHENNNREKSPLISPITIPESTIMFDQSNLTHVSTQKIVSPFMQPLSTRMNKEKKHTQSLAHYSQASQSSSDNQE